MGRGDVSTGLGRAEDTDEQREASGGESSDSGSGLWTSGAASWPCCSAFICAMAVEIAGAMDPGGFLCRRAASVFARRVSPPESWFACALASAATILVA